MRWARPSAAFRAALALSATPVRRDCHYRCLLCASLLVLQNVHLDGQQYNPHLQRVPSTRRCPVTRGHPLQQPRASHSPPCSQPTQAMHPHCGCGRPSTCHAPPANPKACRHLQVRQPTAGCAWKQQFCHMSILCNRSACMSTS